MKIITKYQCDFCNIEYSEEFECFDHEENDCLENPDKKACISCIFFEKIIQTYSDLSEYQICSCKYSNKILNDIEVNCKDWKPK